MRAMIDYRIEAAEPQAHRYRVTLKVPPRRPCSASACRCGFPAATWCVSSAAICRGSRPGRAHANAARTARQVQLAGACRAARHWCSATGLRLRHLGAPAFLDDRRGFFNGTSLCLQVRGPRDRAARLALGRLPRGWQVATAMPAHRAPPSTVRRLRRTGRPPGRAGRLLARRVRRARRAARVRRRRRLARFRRRAAARRHAAHLRGADGVLARPRQAAAVDATCSC